VAEERVACAGALITARVRFTSGGARQVALLAKAGGRHYSRGFGGWRRARDRRRAGCSCRCLARIGCGMAAHSRLRCVAQGVCLTRTCARACSLRLHYRCAASRTITARVAPRSITASLPSLRHISKHSMQRRCALSRLAVKPPKAAALCCALTTGKCWRHLRRWRARATPLRRTHGLIGRAAQKNKSWEDDI